MKLTYIIIFRCNERLPKYQLVSFYNMDTFVISFAKFLNIQNEICDHKLLAKSSYILYFLNILRVHYVIFIHIVFNILNSANFSRYEITL